MEKVFILPGERILVKDLSSLLDLSLLHKGFEESKLNKNVKNKISEDLYVLDSFIYLKDIKTLFEEESTKFLKSCYFDKFEKLKIISSWYNETTLGEYHHRHYHPYSVVSGVFYLDDNPDNLNLNVHVKAPTIPYTEINGIDTYKLPYIFSTNNYRIKSNLKGHLILFLSNLYHDVSKIENEKKARRSLAFNTFFEGTVGSNINPLGGINYNSIQGVTKAY